VNTPRGAGEPPRADAPPGWDEFVREATGNGQGAADGSGEGSSQRSGSQRPGMPDLAPIIAIVEALRRVVPQELQEQFNALQRELLLTLRALIDWYLDRLERPELAPKVEDIPID
jgi:hypothetical protein